MFTKNFFKILKIFIGKLSIYFMLKILREKEFVREMKKMQNLLQCLFQRFPQSFIMSRVVLGDKRQGGQKSNLALAQPFIPGPWQKVSYVSQRKREGTARVLMLAYTLFVNAIRRRFIKMTPEIFLLHRNRKRIVFFGSLLSWQQEVSTSLGDV